MPGEIGTILPDGAWEEASLSSTPPSMPWLTTFFFLCHSLSLPFRHHQVRLLGSKHKACLRDVVGRLKEALGEDAAEMQELLKDYGLNPS